MLKHLKFSGLFNDENLSVSVTLENPADYGLASSLLVFSATIKPKGHFTKLEELTFYIMDEADLMHNTWQMAVPDITAFSNESYEPEPPYQPDGLLLTDFKHDFLFQDLRIAFYCRHYQTFGIIELNH